MGYALIPVPFWDQDMEVEEVVEASRLADFRIRKLSDLGQKRLGFASLQERDDGDLLVLTLRGGDFIVFRPSSRRTP